MKLLSFIILLFISTHVSSALGVDAELVNELSAEAKSLSRQCNLEARNALISGDIKLVEHLCMDAVREIEKSSSHKELTINPLLNLAYSYTLAGYFDKADPLYKRARAIGLEVYKSGSAELKRIDEVIKSHEDISRINKK